VFAQIKELMMSSFVDPIRIRGKRKKCSNYASRGLIKDVINDNSILRTNRNTFPFDKKVIIMTSDASSKKQEERKNNNHKSNVDDRVKYSLKDLSHKTYFLALLVIKLFIILIIARHVPP
jgi:hypothetical protein